MYKILIFISIVFLLVACNKKEAMPVDIEGIKTVLSTKKSEVASLQKEIKELSEKLVVLDPSLQEKSKMVDTMHLSVGAFDRYIELQGTVISDNMANVVSEVPGRITSLRVKEGDYVKKGQLIATLDLESLDKQIAEVETSLHLAKDVFERQERLWNQKIGSEMQFLQAKNNVEQLEKSLETIRFQQTKASVHAPISGYIDMENMKQGEVASPGMPIVQILNTSNLKISTDLPEQYLKIIKRGATVDLEFPSIDLNTVGRVSLLGRSINLSNRTLKVEITPSTKSSLLKPNLLAQIKLKELTAEDVIVIPLQAIMQEVDGTEYVYLAKAQEDKKWRATKTYIKTGEATDNNIIIEEGLTTADVLVTKGTRNLSNQELIHLNADSNE